MIPRPLASILWKTFALVCVALGLIGVVVPGLPTVPFLLLAAWAAGRGWPALEAWLVDHPRHGPSIRRWRERGAVPRRAKWAATLMMTASAGLLWHSPAPLALRVALPLVMLVVVLWLWQRPET